MSASAELQERGLAHVWDVMLWGAPARAFAWLNDALFEDGLWLQLAPEARLDGPLHVVHLGGAGNTSSHLRLLIDLAEHAEAQVVEHYLGLGAEPYHVNVLAQATLAPGARLRHVKLLAEGAAGIHVGDFRVRVGRDARFESHLIAAGGGLLRQDLDVDLGEPGGECSLRGLTTAGSGEHVDFHTRIEHRAPHCRSEETYKGLVGGNGRAVFNGRVHVHPGADRTDSAMTCANLLLSDRAEVDRMVGAVTAELEALEASWSACSGSCPRSSGPSSSCGTSKASPTRTWRRPSRSRWAP